MDFFYTNGKNLIKNIFYLIYAEYHFFITFSKDINKLCIYFIVFVIDFGSRTYLAVLGYLSLLKTKCYPY